MASEQGALDLQLMASSIWIVLASSRLFEKKN